MVNNWFARAHLFSAQVSQVLLVTYASWIIDVAIAWDLDRVQFQVDTVWNHSMELDSLQLAPKIQRIGSVTLVWRGELSNQF